MDRCRDEPAGGALVPPEVKVVCGIELVENTSTSHCRTCLGVVWRHGRISAREIIRVAVAIVVKVGELIRRCRHYFGRTSTEAAGSGLVDSAILIKQKGSDKQSARVLRRMIGEWMSRTKTSNSSR